MTTLLHNARLIDPELGTDAPGSLLIAQGRILARLAGQQDTTAILAAHGLAAADVTLVDCNGKCLAPGIVDIGVKVCEPGERHKESYKSAGLAAAAGGVTTIVTRPDTTPCIDSPETLEFVTRRAQADAPVNVLPMAASPLVAIVVAAVGALLLLLTMHLARGIGKLHGLIAKNLLVRL